MYETALTKMFFVTNSLCISTSIFYEHTKICINFYLTQFLMCKYLHPLSFTNTCELVWITITLLQSTIFSYFSLLYRFIFRQHLVVHVFSKKHIIFLTCDIYFIFVSEGSFCSHSLDKFIEVIHAYGFCDSQAPTNGTKTKYNTCTVPLV